MMPVKSWVSRAGVRLHRRTRASPTATNARSTAVPIAIAVSAMPLEFWYDLPSLAAMPANTAATRTATDWIACTMAASAMDSGRPCGLASGARLACPRARPADREPTCYLHDPAAPGRHRVRPGVRRPTRSHRDTLPGPRDEAGIGRPYRGLRPG